MFDQLLSVVQLRKEIPDPVGYSVFGPFSFPVPVEIRAALPDPVSDVLRDITIIGFRIDNYSSKTQRNVRVLYSGSFSYSPAFSFHRRDVEVRAETKSEDKEIVLLEIPPNESVSIEFFNPTDQFGIEQVLIGDNEVTKTMQRLAEAKRFPRYTRLRLFVVLSVLVAIALTASVFSFAWEKKKERKLVSDAISGMFSCVPYVYFNSTDDEKTLERKFFQLGVLSGFVLSLNKVSSLEELKQKDHVILCEPATSGA